jgi:hypothetical protein
LSSAVFAPVVKALRDGEEQGVFALQLHGLEHYWPAVLVESRDPEVRQWLAQKEIPSTESLPPHLQSRWIDAAVLPSSSLPTQDIEAAAAEETALFAKVVGGRPRWSYLPHSSGIKGWRLRGQGMVWKSW